MVVNPTCFPSFPRDACFSLAPCGSQCDRANVWLTMLTLYMWEWVEAGDKVGPRATVTSARACVFLLIVYIFYPGPRPPPPSSPSPVAPSHSNAQFAAEWLADSSAASSSSPLPARRELVYRSLDVVARADVPPCQGIQPVRSCTRGGKSNVGVPARFLELLC